MAAFPDKPLVIHFHNDFGLGAYNTVRALHHGATIPTCTVNGLGERAGNAPLHTTVMILKELYGVTIPGFRYDMLWALRRKVEEFSGLPVGASEPIIGHNVFSHETGIHTAGITIHPAIYQVIEPEAVGGRLRFLFGKHSGAMAIEAVLARHREELAAEGVEVTPQLVQLLLRLVKEVREKKAHGLPAPRRGPELLLPPRAPGPHRRGPRGLRAGPGTQRARTLVASEPLGSRSARSIAWVNKSLAPARARDSVAPRGDIALRDTSRRDSSQR